MKMSVEEAKLEARIFRHLINEATCSKRPKAKHLSARWIFGVLQNVFGWDEEVHGTDVLADDREVVEVYGKYLEKACRQVLAAQDQM